MESKNQIRSYKDLEIWKRGMSLYLKIHTLSYSFPVSELYGLTAQIKRSAFSIPANIAEGWGRDSKKGFAIYLRISRGSLFETETAIEAAFLLDFCSKDQYILILQETQEIGKMLTSFIKNLEQSRLN